jgi:hypothetical protein
MLGSIRNLGEEGRDFLRLASVLAEAPISGSLVATVFEKADHLNRDTALQRRRKAFHQTTTASLSEIASETDDARSVHALVSRTMRFGDRRQGLIDRANRHTGEPRTGLLRNATLDVVTEMLEAREDVTNIPHLEHVLKLISVLRLNDVITETKARRVSFLSALALYWSQRGDHREPMYARRTCRAS